MVEERDSAQRTWLVNSTPPPSEVDREEAQRWVNSREEFARRGREERALLRDAMLRKPAPAQGVLPVPDPEATG